ncbi:hypothetical protein [Maridesulfovibrio sp.]|uniref:hypothetical protein n=1 Tax=Maridesulfovibrio sp. TaxID=2795000 RepID=UPI003BAB994E
MYPYTKLNDTERKKARKVVEKMLENLSGLTFAESSYAVEVVKEVLEDSRNKADHSIKFKPVSADIPTSLIAEVL